MSEPLCQWCEPGAPCEFHEDVEVRSLDVRRVADDILAMQRLHPLAVLPVYAGDLLGVLRAANAEDDERLRMESRYDDACASLGEIRQAVAAYRLTHAELLVGENNELDTLLKKIMDESAEGGDGAI